MTVLSFIIGLWVGWVVGYATHYLLTRNLKGDLERERWWANHWYNRYMEVADREGVGG